MKRLKIVLVTLIATVGIIALSSFTGDSFKKEGFAVECFFYTGTTAVPNPTGSQIDESTRWSTLPTSNPPDCLNTPRLCAICFNTQVLSLEDAYQALAGYIGNSNQFQSVISSQATVIPVPGSTETVTVYLKPIQ